MQYSLATSKDGQTIIKIHHNFGAFDFYLTPDAEKKNGFGWASDPMISDTKLGQSIANIAAKSIARFAKKEFNNISFGEMKNALEIAHKTGQRTA